MFGLEELMESALFGKINTLSESKTGGFTTGKELQIMLLRNTFRTANLDLEQNVLYPDL
jgi:hypothetical protein